MIAIEINYIFNKPCELFQKFLLFLCLVLVRAYLLFLQLIDAVSERNHLENIYTYCVEI